MPSIKRFIDLMVYYCDVVSVGYDWARRWNVFDGGDTDCSALVITCLKEAGFDVGGATYTGDLSAGLTANGWERIPAIISKAKPGDILLNDVHHVAAVIEGEGWNARVAQASIGETGGVYGNTPGDQTGWETNTTAIYDYPWTCILRYNGPEDTEHEETEFEMAEALFYIDDAHEGYDGGEVVYWSPTAGFCYLEHPHCIELIKMCSPGIAEIHSAKKAPWVMRAKQATNPTVAAKTYGKHG